MIAYIISEKKRENYQKIRNSLLEEGYDVETIDAVFVDSFDQVDTATFYARMMKNMTLGEAGCALAHVNVYKAFLQSEDEWTLICEDDAVLIEKIKLRHICDNLTKLGTRPKIFLLYNTYVNFERHGIRLLDHTRVFFPYIKKYMVDDGFFFEMLGLPLSATAYFINREAARRIIEAQTPVTYVADWPVVRGEVTFLYESVFDHVSGEDSIVGVREDPLCDKKHKFLLYTGIWYMMHRKHFPSIKYYYKRLISPRIIMKYYLLYCLLVAKFIGTFKK